jgi:outer membrane biosynthesis protein TonB
MARKNFDHLDRRNGKIVSAIFHALLLFLFFFLGIGYMDPPPEDGIAINFGYDADGFGDNTSAPTENANNTTQAITPPTEETSDVPDEEVVTQELEDAPAIAPQTKPTPKKPEPVKPEEKPTPTPTPKPKPSDALNNALKSSQSGKGSGEGITEGSGDQGDPNGDPNSSSRTGGAGTGTSGTGPGGGGPGGDGDGNYLLTGRTVLGKPEPEYNYHLEATVVVTIYVDRSGKVVRAEPGGRVNGTNTNTSSTELFERARKAALKTPWSPNPNATELQIGHIIYNFGKK